MNLRDKLLLIDALREKQVTLPQPVFSPRRPADELPLQSGSNQAGNFCFFEKTYPAAYRHGEELLGELIECDASHIQTLAKDPVLKLVELRKCLFIDTETTGLTGGSGTYPFLIGVGFFNGESFCLKQFFMNDLNEEAAILHELKTLVGEHDFLISFNGKCYDIPLLTTRMITHRIQSRLADMKHFDLLFAIRRLWKHRIGDCSLESAEYHLLKFHRFGDIPGYMIPHIYFRFLREKVTTSLPSVFDHNRFDILSMVGLLNKGLKFVSDPPTYCQDQSDILALGKVYESMQRFQEANHLYDHYLQNGATEARQTILMRKAMNYKKLGNWEKAENLWKEYLDKYSFHPTPYIELAKIFEHRKKDYARAASLVAKALGELRVLLELGKTRWSEQRSNLEHRQKRLKTRLKNAAE